MLPRDRGHKSPVSTPRRVQKQLFPVGSSSDKRQLFLDRRTVSPEAGHSGDESDLGPMSPLAFSDRTPSSINSSPGRKFDSPLASPRSSPDSNSQVSWDRLTPRARPILTDVSPFTELKRVTRAARSSPRRKIFPDEKSSVETPPLTPKRLDQNKSRSEIVTETPSRVFGRELQNGPDDPDRELMSETPRKENSPIQRLITPLGSVSKEAALPRLQRRKSSNAPSSPVNRTEKSLKRHACDSLASLTAKLFKSEENTTIPRARAALFQEKKEFKLSTKSFYSSALNQKRERSLSVEWRDVERARKKRSPPVHLSAPRRTVKRRKYGEINAGVGHGIRKPKPKRHVSRSEAFKKQKQNLPPPFFSPNLEKDELVKSAPGNDSEIREEPETDPSKKFFKSNRTMKLNRVATVTVNNKIKLQVSKGKIALESEEVPRNGNLHKKARLADLNFDANDLTVDEPGFDSSMDQGSVANILKILEADWADDDYDTMVPLTSNVSPLKLMNIPKDVMSPASELSNMTSVMNIEDAAGPKDFENILNNNDEGSDGEESETTVKYYPLFNKGYTGNKTFEETNTDSGRGIKRVSWQMTAKAGCKDDQYQLDVGQKRFGASQCSECGVVYQLGDPEDENDHLNYHNSVNILKFPGWKNERVVGNDDSTSSRILLVMPGDSKTYWKKVADILDVVDKDLGLSDMKLSECCDKKVYLYVREKRVLGVLVAEYVSTAHRMIPELIELDCCTSESSPAKCGVNVVWTAMSHRRQGIATKLMDVLRANYYYGYVMSMDDVAFSMPTPSGKAFAEKYTKTRNFKVYS